MAAGTLYSAQRTNEIAVPAVPNKPDTCGVVVRKYFSGTVAGTDVAVGTTISLCKIPKGARIMGGKWYNDGTFAGAGVTIDIGDGTTADRFADGIDVSGENFTEIPNAAGEGGTGYGHLCTAETEIIATTIGDVIVADGVYKGHIDYIGGG